MQPTKRNPAAGRAALGYPLSGSLARRQGWPGHTGAISPPPRAYDGHGGDRARQRGELGDGGVDCGGGRLRGRKALIAGSDPDWGRAVATAFASEGADVAFTEPPQAPSAVHPISRSIRRSGRKPVALRGDLGSEAACGQLVADSVRALAGLDILVIDAGRPRSVAGPRNVDDIAHMSTEQFDATFRGNIYAMFWLTKAALPHLAPGSSIINTGPPSGAEAHDIELDYSATKGAIMVFTRSLARQLAGRGIRVNAVAPEPIWTPRAGADEPASGQRPGRQEQLVATYVWLASTESSYATGQLHGAVEGPL